DLIEQNYIGNFSCCMYRSEIVRKLPEKIFEFFTVDWMFNLCCGELGKIGFLRDWMSVYRKHSTGAWAGRSELENLYQLLAVIDTYNEFLNYKYDVHFIKLKAKINYFINISEKHSKFNPIWNVIKSVLGPFVRGMWKAISFLGQQSNLVYQKSNRAMMLIWNNLLKPTLRPFARKLRGLKATLSLQSQLAFRKIRTRHTDLLILDTLFPHPLSPFRYQEFISYLDRFPSALVLTTGEHLPTPALKETRQIGEIINEFEMEQPEYSGRTIIISHNIEYYEARLAYIVFLYNVSVFLPALELKQIPFVFTLYPGGGFRLNVEESDKMLKRVISSPCFRKVIVTQKNTYDYLISKNFCKSEQIEFIYGVVTPLNLLKNRLPKKYFGYEKNTLDICFVAHKYMEAGIDKGYDVFIETAKKLVATHCNIHFHIVGDFTDADLPIQGLDGRITFYGPRKNKWLENFYIDKDIILSPNIPFKVMDGSFDGFPTASCTEAGLRKVAVFCTDELHLNVKFTSGEDLVIIPHDSDKIVQLLEFYYSNPAKLKKLAETGSEKFRTVYNYENQILPRIRIIEAELQGEANEIFSTPNLL
ncbi:MAG TPA: glycosyltransferase family 4 protein, partial [Chitinophagaceae bacterium]|nr:glycosyltransferase family 4 protein [Chitinophagaceae bacterium]